MIHSSKARYYPPDKFLSEYKQFNLLFPLKEIGRSVNNQPIYVTTIGKGKFRVLAWSQMHGNETTTTRALIKLMHSFRNNQLEQVLENVMFNIIFQLNPDGSQMYTRVNANDVDLNRDAMDQSQPETKALMQIFNTFEPDLCLNLHGQRTVFAAGNKPLSAALSFLAPSADERKRLTPARKMAMRLIASLVMKLKTSPQWGIGRYDDSFNINCTGDFFSSKGVPTILFEAGHHPNDYDRNVTTDLIHESLHHLLGLISRPVGIERGCERYAALPKNEAKFYDVEVRLFTNVNNQLQLHSSHFIQYKEVLSGNEIVFAPLYIGQVSEAFSHQRYDYTISNDDAVNFFKDIASNIVDLIKKHR